ncbi:MAG: LacI family DNA-binding transcriptional regulator, partial [Ruminiclostridium sp.]
MIKIKQIAQKAGVSLSTVSLVINNKPGVKESTRSKVMDIINDYGYAANLYENKPSRKRAIRFLKYKSHGLVVDENGFISSLIDGVNIGARELGYDVILTTINRNDAKSIFEIVNSDPKDGIIILGTEMDSADLTAFKDITTPIVIVDSYFEYEDYDCIVMNNIDGTFKAINFLYNKGFREIGHFESSVSINNFKERKEGYLNSLKSLGLTHKPEYTFRLESTMDGSYNDMIKILKKMPKLPEAIFSDNDTIAIGAIKALMEFNIKVPDDISVIGFDDIPFCTMINPPLTTIKIL